MPAAEELVDAARAGRLAELHDALVGITTAYDDLPRDLLERVAAALSGDEAGLPPRAAVVMRLLRAGALDAAWAVIRDNAVGVVEETLRTSTSSGARPTAQRLPLATYVEPPRVFAWLPGFRDPRFGAPESAYDVTPLVTPSVRLDEAWWDGGVLVLAGLGSLRHLPTAADDTVAVVLRRGERTVEVDADRVRRPDLVRGSGAELTRGAWAGWAARIDAAALPRGRWQPALLVTQRGISREAPLRRPRAGAVAPITATRVGGRAELHVDGAGATLLLGSPLLARGPRGLLHAVARRAPRR